ncbi:MAG: Ldh family oxidoreductase [Parvibaculaceae bacterium]
MATTYSVASLRALCQSIGVAAGLRAEDARLLSDCLIDAELRGVESHGLVHLPMYVEWIDDGFLNPHGQLEIVRDSGPTVVMNANRALGQRAGVTAMDLASERASKFGVGYVGIRNSGSFGAAGYYPLRAVEKGQIGFALQNTAPHLTPPGGVKALVGNSPFAIGIPTGEIPILLDIACSNVARANLIMAAKNGTKIPLDWAVDEHGKPTDDPNAGLLGSLLPFAGHKGYGLAFTLGLLAGPLVGADDRSYDTTWYFPRPNGFGILIVAINIEHFVDPKQFEGDVKDWLQRIRTAETAPGHDRLYFPGERAHSRAQTRTREGIEIPHGIEKDLLKLAKRFNCRMPDMQARSQR